MKIALLTMFNGLSTTYSLVNVVAEHIKMILNNNHQVKLIVTDTLNDNEKWGIYKDERIEWCKIDTEIDGESIKLYDYSNPKDKLHNSFYKEADFFASQFENVLKDVDVCMLHDILYQGWNYVYNIAIRKAQKNLPKLKFIAFTHSFPANRPINPKKDLEGRYVGMENTVFAYPSHSGLTALAKQYNVAEGSCHTVYNTVPIIESLCDEVQDLHKKTDLLTPEILIVYPARLSTGKKFEKVVSLAGAIKIASEKSVKVIFCDFPCMDTPSKDYKEAINLVGTTYGLNKSDIIFTSEYGYQDGFPRYAVLDLFTLSNLYICPSFSETFGLTVAEAASRGNFIVVNKAVPALEEVGKMLGAYFMEWDARNYGFDTKQTYTPNETAYVLENASKIVQLMRESNPIKAKTITRTRFNSDWVWKNQIEPLLHNN